MSDFTEEEKRILAPFFTNMDKPVFVLVNLPEVVKGALFSRYSRSPKPLRRILLEEFILSPEMGFADIIGKQTHDVEQLVAIQKAEDFYDRVLVGYGDDSVAELGGAHIALEGISHIASKIVEDARIGISPLEKSTRYVFFDEKVSGKYQYVLEPTIARSPFRDEYIRCMDMLFDTYVQLIEPTQEFLRKKFPKDADASDRAYRSTIRAKAADILRGLLPAGVKTNVGLYGNGRAFEYLLVKMRACPLTEIQSLRQLMQEELDAVIPSFVKRAKGARGDKYVEYLDSSSKNIDQFIKKLKKTPGRPIVESRGAALVDYRRDSEDAVLSAILYSQTHQPWKALTAIVRNLSRYKRKQLLSAYVAGRSNRHQKIGRALEQAYYTFDIIANFGAYRDLHRHRMLTQSRQDLTTRYGYDVPDELSEAHLENVYTDSLKQAEETFEHIVSTYPKPAQYVVPNAYRMRWTITLNLREVVHLCELRSSPQGHPHYRHLAQMIAQEVLRVHPWARCCLPFVDFSQDIRLERLESERRIDQKLANIRYNRVAL